MTERTEAVVRAELSDVERHLAEAPPHSGAGVRDHLAGRRDELRRELARMRTRTDPTTVEREDATGGA